MARSRCGTRAAASAILAFFTAMNPVFAQDKSEQEKSGQEKSGPEKSGQAKADGSTFMATRLQAIRSQPLTLDSLVSQNWFQIPLSERGRLGISTPDYTAQFAGPAAEILDLNASKLDESLKARFDALKLDTLKTQRDRGQPIAYCSWIPAARLDGLIPRHNDFLTRFRRSCRGFAITTVNRLAPELARKTDPSLEGIRQLTDTVPRWLAGDLVAASAEGPNLDLIAFDQDYRNAALLSLQQILPTMQRAVEGHFRTLGQPGIPLPQPATLCRETLRSAYLLTGFAREIGETLRTSCLSEGGRWATRHQDVLATRLVDAIHQQGAGLPVRSAGRLCAEASNEILGDGALLDTPGRQDLALKCQQAARETEARMIARAIATLLETTRTRISGIREISAANWLVFDAKQISPLIDTRENTNAKLIQTMIERANVEAAPIRAKLIEQFIALIVDAHAKARKSLAGLQAAQALCNEVRRVTRTVPASVNEAVARLNGRCQAEGSTFYQEQIERALARSGIGAVAGKMIGINTAAYDPKALVIHAALAGRQLTFSSAWFGSDISFSVTSTYDSSIRLAGKLKPDSASGRLLLAEINAIPDYSADPATVAACLFSSPDDDARKTAEILGEMQTLLHGLVLAWRSEIDQERCNRALRTIFPS